jgi:hypothetical protein
MQMNNHIEFSTNAMRSCSRRQFVAGALAGAGILAATPKWLASAEARSIGNKNRATEITTLGSTGIKVSRLAQGTGWNGGGRSSAHSRLGEEKFTKLIRHSLDRGITLMDMADLYGVHPYVRTALDGVPRDKYRIMSKSGRTSSSAFGTRCPR